MDLLPPEMLLKVLSEVQPLDQLSVKLVSKTFKTYVDISTASRPKISKSTLISSHLFIEQHLPRNRPFKDCICTHCAKVLPRRSFSDNQGRKTNPNRICIACGIQSNTYTPLAPPRVDKVLRLPCKRCKTAAMPLKTWKKKIISATQLYFDVPGHDAHCEECLETEIGCKMEEYSDLKSKTRKKFEQLVFERMGVEEWAELGTRSLHEFRMRINYASLISDPSKGTTDTARIMDFANYCRRQGLRA